MNPRTVVVASAAAVPVALVVLSTVVQAAAQTADALHLDAPEAAHRIQRGAQLTVAAVAVAGLAAAAGAGSVLPAVASTAAAAGLYVVIVSVLLKGEL